MATVTVELIVTIRWWVRPYLEALMVFATAFDLEPDAERIARFISKYGLRVGVK